MGRLTIDDLRDMKDSKLISVFAEQVGFDFNMMIKESLKKHFEIVMVNLLWNRNSKGQIKISLDDFSKWCDVILDDVDKITAEIEKINKGDDEHEEQNRN